MPDNENEIENYPVRLNHVLIGATTMATIIVALISFIANGYTNRIENVEEKIDALYVDNKEYLTRTAKELSSNIRENDVLIRSNIDVLDDMKIENKEFFDKVDARIKSMEDGVRLLAQLAIDQSKTDGERIFAGLPLDQGIIDRMGMGSGEEPLDGYVPLTQKRYCSTLEGVTDFVKSEEYEEVRTNWGERAKQFWLLSGSFDPERLEVSIYSDAYLDMKSREYVLEITAIAVQK